MMVAGVWKGSDSEIWIIAVPGLKIFGTAAESESEKVTLATSVLNQAFESVP